MSAKTATSLITRRLYRNLLRTVEPFTAPSPNAAVLTSLLHRSGIDDHIQNWAAYVEKDKNHRTYQRLFRRLLRVIMTGTENGYETTVFPSKVDTTRLRKIIRNEFRAKYSESQTLWASSYFDDATRQKVAFCALRELNKKLSYYEWLKQNSPEPMYPERAAQNVSSLPTHPPASYLRPGVFLVSHPYMQNSYFSRSVICILEHKGLGSVLKDGSSGKKDGNDDDDDEEDDDDVISEVLQGELELDRVTLRRRNARRRTSTPPGQTYGVIVNRVSQQIDTGQNRTLKEVFREHALPERLADAFGKGSMVREGGPVHVALQMIHTLPSSENDVAADVGGTVIPYISSEEDDESSSYDDKTTYFQGNMFKAISNVEKGTMHKDEVSFFVGASVWAPGQLAAEIAQGYWIPCRGPPDMALDGTFDMAEPETPKDIFEWVKQPMPIEDLWLSMMSACGEDEAKLSHLFLHDHWDENGMPCDSFDDDDDDDDIVVF